MEVQELFTRLDQHKGSFPKDRIAEIIARREEVTPRFVAMLEDIDRDPEPWLVDQERMIHIYALYLLALFRETRAYPLLVRIFSSPGEFPFELAGDVVTQDLGRMLTSVSGGDVSGMTALIENELANEYVRSVAMDSMVSLVATGQRTREDVMSYFVQLFHKLKRKPGAQWDGLANACTDLWPQEAIEELRRAYEHGLVDLGSIEWGDIDRSLALGQQGSMQQRHRDPVISDLARDMGWMQCFQKAKRNYEEDSDEDLPAVTSSEYSTIPIRRSVAQGRSQRPLSLRQRQEIQEMLWRRLSTEPVFSGRIDFRVHIVRRTT
jgi:hypothetical protein